MKRSYWFIGIGIVLIIIAGVSYRYLGLPVQRYPESDVGEADCGQE